MRKKYANSSMLFCLMSCFYVFISCGQQPLVARSIPVNAQYWYQLNSVGEKVTTDTGLQQLTDGVVDKEVFMGWGKILPTYDCYYEFKDLSDVYISKIRLYDGKGSFASQPLRLYAKSSITAPPILLETFTGEAYEQWIEVNIPTPVKVKYLILNTSWGFPTEIEFYGTYKIAPPVTLHPGKDIKLANELGVNSFIWDFLQSEENPNIRYRIYEPKMDLMQSFTQFRDYVDWEKIESTEGKYAFDPTVSGGWNYDLMYERLKQEGKEILPCLKTVPNWFLEKNYPVDQRDAENIPAAYNANLLDPNSYSLQAKLAFQFAARYGRNKALNPALLQNVMTGPVYLTAPQAGSRSSKIGLGYIKYLECENERDKWWKGRKAYQTAREYAANLSAFYDGHKNTMGPGVGVKNADPTMQVVLGGTASAQTDYIRGIIDWCKEYRGYKADGTVDLCFDIINYHCYANSSGVSQSASSARGAAPEVVPISTNADAFVKIAQEYNKEVWITEAGYDINPGSPLRVPAIGDKSPTQVQADWILRTAFLYARHGINRLFFYQSSDLDLTSSTQFASSGLLDGATHKRKPAADYLFQVQKLMGNYVYKETLNTNPLIDRYELSGQSIYMLVMPTEQGAKATYFLNVGKSGTSRIYTPKVGSNLMDVQIVNSFNGTLKLVVTETPVFVVPNQKQEVSDKSRLGRK
jgi:endoglucanase